MEIRDKNILLISPEPWDHIFVSKHHYAIHLAQRGNRVFFLNPPAKVIGIEKTGTQDVFSLYYKKFPTGLRFYPRVLQQLLMKRKFRQLQRISRVEFHVIWSFDNSVFFDLSFLPLNILKFCHIVDVNQDFQTRQLAVSVDYCFCNTELIRKRLLRYNDRVYKIQHGYNIPGKLVDIKLPGKSGIKVMYSGNLSIPFIDWEILFQIISAHQSVDFIFLGPNAIDFRLEINPMHSFKQQLMEFDNVFCLGKIEANLIPSYLKKADVMLIAYQEKYQDGPVANSHKMMEYLGSGNVTVSTYTKEFESIKELIAMADSNRAFVELFDAVVSQLSTFNRMDVVEKRKLFAVDNSYENQIKRIEAIISSGL